MPDAGGTLIAIGGHEDRDGDRLILRAVAAALDGATLLVAATASHRPARYIEVYREAFGAIGVRDVRELAIRDRADALDPELVNPLVSAGGVFFTGGSQARLVDAIRDTPAHSALRGLWRRGGVIAGTSAGAAALGETMIAGTDEPHLLPGLGFVPRVVLDQHFSQRDRIDRLVEGMSHDAAALGIGIDENTALVIRGDDAEVIGVGVVTVVDGDEPPRTLVAGERLRLPSRTPMR